MMSQFTVGGVQFLLSREKVEEKLRGVAPESVRELYVLVNGIQYPVKQALAEAAGLQRGMFTSHDAMRVFRKLNLVMGPDESTVVEKLFTSLKSLSEFDRLEMQGVVAGQLSKSPREESVYGLYLRARANVQSILSLKQVSDVQAIIMLARNLFELAVDTKLLDTVSNGVEKFIAFSDIEKLRSAEKIVAFKKAHPGSRVDMSIVAAFISKNKASIEARRATLWPELKPTSRQSKAKPLVHWSGMNLKERAASLGDPFDEIYESKYAQMSWYTHSAGLTGFDLQKESYTRLAGIYFYVAGTCYMIVLNKVIEEFKLTAADEKIKNRMRYAQLMAIADTDEQVQHIAGQLFG
jgi:hypothetical protein